MFDEIIDLSVPIYEGMPVDDLGPKFWVRLSHAAARRVYNYKQSREGRVFLTTDHIGTHLDGPLRFDPAGVGVEQIPLSTVIRPASMFDLRSRARSFTIGARELEGCGSQAQPGGALVLWTGHDLYLQDPDYFWNRPQLTGEGADWIIAQKPALVAIDFPGFGDSSDETFAIKRKLHRAGILTVEQLCNLAPLQGKDWWLSAPPIRIRGAAGSLIRAVGLVNWGGKEIVDLAQDIFQGMSALGGAVPTYWNRADHELTAFFSEGEFSYQTTSMFLSEHGGTHLDAPFHFDEHGLAIADLPLPNLIAPAKVLDFSHKKPLEGIAPADLEAAVSSQGLRLEAGDAVVVRTDHSLNYERPDFTTHRAFITAEGAQWIVDKRPGFVVTDLVGLDPPDDPTTPVHLAFLHAGVPFCQVTCNLARLSTGSWRVAVFPLKLVGGTGSPARPYAISV